MPRRRVLAIIQAGGAGSRMDVLTRERAKPALPFAGVFQLVDFALSNLAHSGIDQVWLSVQYQASTLEEQVANGRPWDLDRNQGGLRLLMPQQGSGSLDEDGFARGNADELFRIRDQIASSGAAVVLVMSADHVYRLDYTDVIETHLAAEAECTVVTTTVQMAEAGDHAVVEVASPEVGAAVTDIAYKPAAPTSGLVAAEIFAYEPRVLVRVLEDLHREISDTRPVGDSGESADGVEAGDTGLGDFGDHLLPRLVQRGRTVAHPLSGYWRDLGRPDRYLRAHRDVLRDDAGLFGIGGWPILSHQPQRPPARLLEGSDVADSMVSPGCTVAGAVRRSVLGPGVVVEPGAEILDSVIFGDTVVRAGARVALAIVDVDCTVGADARVGEPPASTDDLDDLDAITLVGRGSTVADGVVVAAGARLEPGTSA